VFAALNASGVLLGIAASYAISAPHPFAIHWPASPAIPRRYRRAKNLNWLEAIAVLIGVAVVLSAILESVLQ